MFIEMNKKKDKTGRRKFTVILHEIYPDETLVDNTGTEYNRNGISWIRQYVEPNLESIHGMSLTVEFIDDERSQICGHGETDLTGGDDGLPLFENATVVGYFEKGWIDTIEIDGEEKTVVLGSGFIDEMRYPKFVKWLLDSINNDGTVFGSIEFFKKEGNSEIIYLDGYKEKGRVPVEYMYSGFALLDMTAPADNTATLLEINSKKEKEKDDMNEKALAEFVETIKNTIVETNSQSVEAQNKIAELNSEIIEKNNEISNLNESVEKLQKALADLKEEHEREMDTYWSERGLLEQEIAKMKVEKRLAELNAALEPYSETELGYAKEEIEKFKSDPVNCGIEINSITTIIKANSYDAIRQNEAKKKKAEINSASTEFDIFGSVEDEDSGSESEIFENMFN